jgi:integrase
MQNEQGQPPDTPQNDSNDRAPRTRTKRRPTEVKYLTAEEISALFGVITSVRDQAIFRVTYHRGLRASEPGLLQLADYRISEGRLFVHRLKGSKSGEYLLVDVERAALDAWLAIRGTAPGPLFPSKRRQGISRWRVDDLMKQYCALAGIAPDKAHCHSLKHSSGTHFYELVGDIAATQDHLGHRNIQNTMIYVDISNRRRDKFAKQILDWR